MTTTTSAYLAVSQNLPRYQAMTAAEPAVKSATAYYEANIGGVTSIQDFVGNYRLLSYALDAYGLGDQINSTALITQVLEGGVSNPKSLANTLSEFALEGVRRGFQFRRRGGIFGIVGERGPDDNEQLCRAAAGERSGRSEGVGVQLALYFQRVAPTVTSEYGILADPNLLEVAQTILGLSPSTSAQNLDHAGADAVRADADIRFARSSETAAAHREIHRDVRRDVWAEQRRDHKPYGRFKQFEFGPIRRRCGSRRRHQFERLSARQRRSAPSPARPRQMFSDALMSSLQSFTLGRMNSVGAAAERNLRRKARTSAAAKVGACSRRNCLPCAARAPNRAALTAPQNSPDALYAAAVILWREQQREKAIELIDEALRRRPDFADALCMGGYMLGECGKPEPALCFYRRALELDASLVVAHVNSGKLLFGAGRFAEALGRSKRRPRLRLIIPTPGAAAPARLRELGRLEELLEAARRALALRPDFAEAAINLGNALSEARPDGGGARRLSPGERCAAQT